MEARVLAPLTALEASLTSLLSSLTVTNTFSSAPAAARDLLVADDDLTSSLGQLKQHQTNYARILHLRSEAARLQEQLRTIVRTCVDLRSEIADIHPSILDDEEEDDDDDDEGQPEVNSLRKEVDYETLLAFAARIGKHNAAAAREAERESDRRRIETTKRKMTEVNGDNLSASQGEPDTTTEESQAALASVNDALAFQRAHVGMAFPPPDRLRMGALGQLQLLREQQGDEAVEKEIERLIMQSEIYAESEISEDVSKEDQIVDLPRSEQKPAPRPAQASRSVPAPAKVKPVSLDFDDSDDDDD